MFVSFVRIRSILNMRKYREPNISPGERALIERGGMGVVGQTSSWRQWEISKEDSSSIFRFFLVISLLQMPYPQARSYYRSFYQIWRPFLQAAAKVVSVKCEFGRKLDQLGTRNILWTLGISYPTCGILSLFLMVKFPVTEFFEMN